VVEVEVVRSPVVATDRAPAAELLDEHALETLVATGHGLAHAALATQPSVGVAVVDGRPMVLTLARDVVPHGHRRSARLLHKGLMLFASHERTFASGPDGPATARRVSPVAAMSGRPPKIRSAPVAQLV
jgi:hypothetical protein